MVCASLVLLRRPGAVSGPGGTLRGAKATQAFCSEARQNLSSHGDAPTRQSNPASTKLLQVDADRYSGVAATVGSINVAGYQLASRDPVMAIGGFHESDPVPTIATFKRYVFEERIHYFIVGDKSFVGHPASDRSD